MNYRLSRPGAAVPLAVNYDDKTKIDEEYLSLMAELGEGKAETGHRPTGGSGGGSRFSSGGLFDRSSAPKALMSTGSHHQHQPPVPPPSVGGILFIIVHCFSLNPDLCNCPSVCLSITLERVN